MIEDIVNFIKQNKVLVISVLVFFMLYCKKKQKKLEKFTDLEEPGFKTYVEINKCNLEANKNNDNCDHLTYCKNDVDCSGNKLNKCNTNRFVKCDVSGFTGTSKWEEDNKKVKNPFANTCGQCIDDVDCNISPDYDSSGNKMKYSHLYKKRCVAGKCKYKDYIQCSDQTHCDNENYDCKITGLNTNFCLGNCYPNKQEILNTIDTYNFNKTELITAKNGLETFLSNDEVKNYIKQLSDEEKKKINTLVPRINDLIELVDIFENDKMKLKKIGNGDISKISERYIKIFELNKAPDETECNDYTPCIKGCGEIKSKDECINKETNGTKICIWDDESNDCSGYKICFRNKCINKEDSSFELLDYFKDLKNKLKPDQTATTNSNPDQTATTNSNPDSATPI
jgi:hypothetical protein